MISMYTKKKKREVNPNAAPRPTLLGHEKEMKVWREQFGHLAKTNTEQAIEMAMLRRKINRLESQLEAVTSVMKRNLR